jgi:hypothetical protein
LLDGGSGWWDFAVDWLVGDGLGVLVVGSTILALASPAPPRAHAPGAVGRARRRGCGGHRGGLQLERIYLA